MDAILRALWGWLAEGEGLKLRQVEGQGIARLLSPKGMPVEIWSGWDT